MPFKATDETRYYTTCGSNPPSLEKVRLIAHHHLEVSSREAIGHLTHERVGYDGEFRLLGRDFVRLAPGALPRRGRLFTLRDELDDLRRNLR